VVYNLIYIERTINIKKNQAKIEEAIILYKGDKNIELQFIIENNPFKYKAGLDATYGQLIIKRPNTAPIFSNIAKLSSSKVLFTITGEMIDELIELGNYDFQIRLLNSDMTSRGTLPPVTAGIVIKEPICEEAAVNRSAINEAYVASEPISLAYEDGDGYNKTVWTAGDLITDNKLNKVENTLDYLVDNAANHSHNEYVTNNQLDEAISNVSVDLTGYATEDYVNNAINTIELTPGPQGERGEQGPAGENGIDGKDGADGKDFTYDMFTPEQLEALRGPQGEQGIQGPEGPAGKDANVDLTAYYTKEEVDNAISNIQSGDGFTHTMVTQAEYDALSDEEKNAEDTLYIITESDAVDSYYTKSDIDKMLGDINTILDAIIGEDI
jgi:hypothetical protein